MQFIEQQMDPATWAALQTAYTNKVCFFAKYIDTGANIICLSHASHFDAHSISPYTGRDNVAVANGGRARILATGTFKGKPAVLVENFDNSLISVSALSDHVFIFDKHGS